jgi:hypothetical protein
MLDPVVASRFDRRMTSGRTWPCALACERANGQEVEVVAKFSAGLDRGTAGLAAEAIASMLAVDLDLPTPEPMLVSFDDSFIDAMPAPVAAVAQRLRDSVRVAFGSAKLPPGFAELPRGKQIPASVRQQAAEIFAFDCLIQNADRRPENPNLLFDGRSFALFDHELAFFTEGVIGWQPPWQTGSLQSFARGHVLFDGLSGRTYDFARMKGAWQATTDRRLNEFADALPAEWSDTARETRKALDFLSQVRENIEPALDEVARVLT